MNKTYDIAVIGGGPAGMIAAGKAGSLGARVILLEKNDILGKKLLITGKGRCNITNADFNIRSFIEKFGKKGKFLYPSLNTFGSQDIINFFNKRGLPTKIERGKRVFPEGDRAKDVLDILSNYLYENKVEVIYNSSVNEFITSKDKISKIICKDKKIIADNYILCTGGLSYPATGSNGDGYKLVEKIGHSITKIRPALAPIILKESWVNKLQGLSLKNVSISIFQNNKKVDDRFGEALFTHNGLSGPIILDMSKKIGELINHGEVKLFIDFKPAINHKELDIRLQRDLNEFKNKMFKNSLDKLLPKTLIPVIIQLSDINPEKQANSITKEERKKIVNLLKHFVLYVECLENIDKAIITSGGIKLDEIEPKTMQSKKISNLYLAGEILDLDGPTGGYNLQVCWSTGYLAGKSVVSG
ncbi:MAG: NAD(P)/FAD-dependent oxidoreductase [Spirochaetes bacterium]|nr:NAD(P)/FAD-dependent oxidoreductase [Spirochaetota bacterium]